MQICCARSRPEGLQVGTPLVPGIVLPACYLANFEVSHPRKRYAEWGEVVQLMLATLRASFDVLIHCRAGVHRAAIAALKALMALKMTEQVALQRLQDRRATDVAQMLAKKEYREWVDTNCGGSLVIPAGAPKMFVASQRSNGLVRVVPVGRTIAACSHAQSAANAEALLRHRLEATTLREAAGWGRTWCRTCRLGLPANLVKEAKGLGMEGA